jgi:hypothetical protein
MKVITQLVEYFLARNELSKQQVQYLVRQGFYQDPNAESRESQEVPPEVEVLAEDNLDLSQAELEQPRSSAKDRGRQGESRRRYWRAFNGSRRDARNQTAGTR